MGVWAVGSRREADVDGGCLQLYNHLILSPSDETELRRFNVLLHQGDLAAHARLQRMREQMLTVQMRTTGSDIAVGGFDRYAHSVDRFGATRIGGSTPLLALQDLSPASVNAIVPRPVSEEGLARCSCTWQVVCRLPNEATLSLVYAHANDTRLTRRCFLRTDGASSIAVAATPGAQPCSCHFT